VGKGLCKRNIGGPRPTFDVTDPSHLLKIVANTVSTSTSRRQTSQVHPLDLLPGHLLAENSEELAARLRERFRSYERIKNQDLDRAVMRRATGDIRHIFRRQKVIMYLAGPWPHSGQRPKTRRGGDHA
jgi:hypothetical protein